VLGRTVPHPAEVAQLTNSLQSLTFQATAQKARSGVGTETRPYLPLLVAVEHEGDGYPIPAS